MVEVSQKDSGFKVPYKAAVCSVCPRRCHLKEGQQGFCHARINKKGKIISQNYGCITAMALDPIEKKPLADFYPGTVILSVGSYGCNLRCPFCQNHQISEAGEKEAVYRKLSSRDLVHTAETMKSQGNIGIAFTYNEPTIGWEYVLDTEKLAKKRELVTVMVTNGYTSPEVWDKLLPYTDGMNIDLKSFNPEFYKRIGGDLETVKENIITASKKCHVELTTLIIPGENDSLQEMRALAGWVASVNPRIPLHISRFFPRHRMTRCSATPISSVRMLVEEARKHLTKVFPGNC